MSTSILSQSPEKVTEPLSNFAQSLDSSLPSSAIASTTSFPDTTSASELNSSIPRSRTTSHTSLLRKSTASSQADKMVGLKATLALPKSTGSRTASPAPAPSPSGEGQHRNGGHSSMHISLPKVRSRSGDGNKRGSSMSSTPHGPMSPPILGGTLSPAPSGNGTSSLKQLSSILSGRSTPHAAPNAAVASPFIPASASATATPTPHAVGANGVAIPGLEASYVTKVGMALNDAVNKVFPSPATVISTAAAGYNTVMSDSALVTYKGLCAPRVDRAREVGNMISNELHLAVNDQYLLRSLVRSAVLKTLSIFLSRLESLIISPSSDPTILTVPRTVKDAENPPLSQRYSFLILRSAWELKKGLNRACASADGHQPGSEMPKFVKDTLSPWITKLDLLVNRVWGPILAAIKDETVKCITVQGAVETGLCPPATLPSPAIGATLALPAVSNGRSLSLSRASTPTPAPSATPAGASAALSVPTYLKDLSAILAATSRTFAWLSVAEVDHQNWKVAIGSSVIWKMMMLTSFRRVDECQGASNGSVPARRPSPPPSSVNGSTPSNGAASGASTPTVEVASAIPRRSMSAMGIGRLRGTSSHSNSGKRSPSPPARTSRESTISQNAARLVVDVEVFEACVEKFVSSLSLVAPTASFDESNPNSQACAKNKDCAICKGRFIPVEVDDSDDEDELPREAMQEAMTALSSFIVVLRFFAFESANPVPKLLRAIAAVDDLSLAPEICPNLIRALDLLPPLILLQTLVARIPSYYEFRMPNHLWNTSWKQYETTMKGFHTGEEWVAEVGWELLKEARRVGKRMSVDQHAADGIDAPSSKGDGEGWLELLRLAIVELGEVDDLDEDGSISNSNISLRGAKSSD